MDIKLNLINHSNDTNNSEIVIFSRNVATGLSETALAWLVIKNLGQGWNHPFTYPTSSAVGASDSYGNYTPQLAAEPGQLFHIVLSTSGDTLSYAGAASSATEIQIRNDLPRGAINANIFKAGKLFAQAHTVSPGQKAVFEFKPTIWIGVASQIEEGSVMNSAIISDINTELSLLGIASADIVMTGGGAGPSATPFAFSLQNIVMA
jgi:hypothetical protein